MSTTDEPRQSTVHRRPPKVFEALEKHEYTFLILHGRGDSPANFAPFLLTSPTADGGSFARILKNAKLIFLPAGISLMGGGAWFDITSLKDPNKNSQEQLHGLREHVKIIDETIQSELHSGIPHEHIILIGLSQGCAQSLFTLLTLGHRLGAVIGMSGWLPQSHILNSHLTSLSPSSTSTSPAPHEHALQTLQQLCQTSSLPLLPDDSQVLKTPIFLGHGTADMTVDPSLGEAARDTLQRLGFEVEWFPYQDFGHWWKAPEELDDFLEFLKRHVGVTIGEKAVRLVL